MDSNLGVNASIVTLALFGGLWAAVTTVINPLAGALLVGIFSKGVDILVRRWLEARKDRWRQEVLRLRKENKRLKRERERRAKDAAQL